LVNRRIWSTLLSEFSLLAREDAIALRRESNGLTCGPGAAHRRRRNRLRKGNMARRFISTGSVYEKLAGYSRAVVDGRFVFVSGTVGADLATGVFADGPQAQAERAIDTIEWALREAGARVEDVVQVRVYVADRAHVTEVSHVVARRLGPARATNTTICAPLAVAEALVEIEVTALKPTAKNPLQRRNSPASARRRE
jgi:enamine deaminase RidA (YjgF/YER057c/UK114 family)